MNESSIPMSNYELILAGARAIMVPGFVYELRVLRAGQPPMSGYFDDAEKLAREATKLDGKGYAIYVTLNPCVPDLLKRAPNRVRDDVGAGETTGDSQILCRFRVLVDFDPERPARVCSTDAEKSLAFQAAELMRDKLQIDAVADSGDGLYCSTDKPVLCDSGNGAHLLYRVAWPNNAEITDAVERALQTIKRECPVAGVHVDTSVGNAARITRLYGSLNCKGANTPERPWRRSGVLS